MQLSKQFNEAASKEQNKRRGENIMRRTMKRVAALGLAGIMVGSLTACTGGSTSSQGGSQSAGTTQAEGSSADSQEEVTLKISWWGNQNRHDYTQKILDLLIERGTGAQDHIATGIAVRGTEKGAAGGDPGTHAAGGHTDIPGKGAGQGGGEADAGAVRQRGGQ